MTGEAKLVADMLQPEAEAALKSALERFYKSDMISHVWPSAATDGVPLSDVEIIVLSLDRIGAPAGASGAGVYVAYYSHAVDEAKRHAASLPLVVKIGPAAKLRLEREGALKWPPLNLQHKGKFAFPLHLDEEDTERSILLAPFQSQFQPAERGSRNEVKVRDLWRLLNDKNELSATGVPNWERIAMLVAQALDAMEPAHRGGRGHPVAAETDYATQYEWHLRETTHDNEGSTRYIISALFGVEATTFAFGKHWLNPELVVQRIINRRMPFNGVLGAIHGDLHPKNIVLSDYDAVQIIDFGWATTGRHIALDYLLLDLNLRGTTLPSQISEQGILSLAAFLKPSHDLLSLPEPVRGRASIIKDVIWQRANARVVQDSWETEYMIPLFLVGYGLLVHLDSARNQPALVATVLQLAEELDSIVPPGPAA